MPTTTNQYMHITTFQRSNNIHIHIYMSIQCIQNITRQLYLGNRKTKENSLVHKKKRTKYFRT